jgi:hypothetical protein
LLPGVVQDVSEQVVEEFNVVSSPFWFDAGAFLVRVYSENKKRRPLRRENPPQKSCRFMHRRASRRPDAGCRALGRRLLPFPIY